MKMDRLKKPYSLIDFNIYTLSPTFVGVCFVGGWVDLDEYD